MATDKRIAKPVALHELAASLRVVVAQLQRRLREEAHLGDFTTSQLSLLRRLESESPSTVTALARAEGVRPQSLGATVAVLEAAGLVRGAPDPADGRQTLLSLTDECRRLVKANRAAREDWLYRAMRARLSPVEREELASSVDLLERLLAP